ncbi:ATP-binding protein [Actinoplanes sp. HUAS TT8]|uniref:ATP-binding protein n=1 Tax=Actinoplanes sp. HUAS TT8 TaxID=3447453 RepID=UPI003F51D0F0
MSYRLSLLRTLLFTVAYALACFAGRLTVMDSTNLSLVWPAAGVAVIWFCAQRQARVNWPDVVAFALITMVINMATGAPLRLALVFVMANLLQVAVFLMLFQRWCPGLWGTGGTQPLRGPHDLWGLLGASFTATLSGATLGPLAIWLLTGEFSWAAACVWLARNTASVLLLGAVVLSVGHAANAYRDRHGHLCGWWRHGLSLLAVTPRRRIAEYLALVATTAVVYTAGFGLGRGLPLTFVLISVTVWAGIRLATPYVALHSLVTAAIAVVFTLHGMGPFAAVHDNAARAFLAQFFVTLIAVVGLALALGRDERDALMAELAAEKAALAAHRDELARFAGVVAHDLLNPVTTVEGWSEAAADALDGVPGVDRARDGLDRVHRAAVRMRNMINGLLDYTTARDAQVAPAPVDLDELVDEITVARVDAAMAAGQPRPRFAVGELPAVHADPVLVRQLLDNLIGNAIKYTAPDVVPALTITGERAGDLVRVSIADNGIGIPAGQHEAIFGNFHRAHRTSAYAGTGLGLGICQRIVERHGGTITAADNPGGGSRLTFTLPAAPALSKVGPEPMVRL